MRKNCPNCGAPIDPWKYKCEYCGTAIVDLGVLDLDNPCYVSFKTHMYGRPCIVTALVKSSNPCIEYQTNTYDVTDGRGNIISSCSTGASCTIDLHLDCLTDTSNKHLVQIITTDEEDI